MELEVAVEVAIEIIELKINKYFNLFLIIIYIDEALP